MAPTKAATGTREAGTSGRAKVKVSAPTAAPPVTPSSVGSESGLRVAAWSTVPQVASAAPAIAATTSRGRRRSSTTRRVSSSPPPARAASTSPGRTATSPAASPAPTATSPSPATPASTSG